MTMRVEISAEEYKKLQDATAYCPTCAEMMREVFIEQYHGKKVLPKSVYFCADCGKYFEFIEVLPEKKTS